MPTFPQSHTPHWAPAALLGLIIGAIPVSYGLFVHRVNVDETLERNVDQFVSEAVRQIDLMLDQAAKTLPVIAPFAGQNCDEPALAAMRREIDLQAHLRNAFIVHDNGQRVCDTYFGALSGPSFALAPNPQALSLQAGDRVTPTDSSLVYSLAQPPYTIHTSMYGVHLATPLRLLSKQVDLLLEIGNAQLDENGRVWGTDRAELLDLRRTGASDRHSYIVHGGLQPEQREAIHRRELTSIISSLLINGILLAGLVFTLLYNGLPLFGRRL